MVLDIGALIVGSVLEWWADATKTRRAGAVLAAVVLVGLVVVAVTR